MRNLIIILLILSSNQKVNAQTDESIISQILLNLLSCSTENYRDTLFFEQNIQNTFFDRDSILMRKETGLQIPQNTLLEITDNSKQSKKDNLWREDLMNEKQVGISAKIDTVLLGRKPYIKCLSEKELVSISTYLPTQSVYSISRLSFDDNHQTAVFQLDHGRGGRYFYSESLLIKKVFGRWIIIQRFGFIMS